MRYLWQHIKTIISTYNGGMPLAHFLKNYCRQHPKLGSRDRRILSSVLYGWYRCSRGIYGAGLLPTDEHFENRVRACLILCNVPVTDYEKLFVNIPITDQSVSFDANALMPHDISLSDGITKEHWLQSMLIQPQLFIRIRKDIDKIKRLLAENNIHYSAVSASCISLPNGAPVDKVLPPDSYVVQDASSQQTGSYFTPVAGDSWYDCCSGAGGKSLLLMDTGVPLRLTVSDTRERIISNLKDRFRLYGHKMPAAYTIDVADSAQTLNLAKGGLFSNIICDVPCSGSGTWARTPEQLYFFNPESITQFAARQKAIALNVARCLKPGGRLLYITCSVFRQENEEVVEAIIANSTLRPVQQQLINGIDQHADSMFIAVLQ